MTVSTPVPLQHLGGEWITGSGDELRSLNPARPDTVVAAGGSSTSATSALTSVVRIPGSPTSQVANPISMSATPATYRSPPPRLGEDTSR